MGSQDIKAELAALRAEVAALAEARKQSEATAEAQGKTAMTADELASSVEDEASPEESSEGLLGDVQELLEALEEELRETPVLTGLIVFSLGILFGRFLR